MVTHSTPNTPAKESPKDDFAWQNGNPEVNGNYLELVEHYERLGILDEMTSDQPITD